MTRRSENLVVRAKETLAKTILQGYVDGMRSSMEPEGKCNG